MGNEIIKMNMKELLKEQATEIHELLSIYIKVHDSIFKKSATFLSLFKRVDFNDIYNQTENLQLLFNKKRNELINLKSNFDESVPTEYRQYFQQVFTFFERLFETVVLLKDRQYQLLLKSKGEKYSFKEYMEIENKYKNVNDYYATFRQEQPVRSLDKVQTNIGEMWIKKPGKIRWNYNIPKNEQIVSDGNYLWYYYVEEKYAIKRDIKDLGGNTNILSLLSDLNNLKKIYKINISKTTLDDTKYYLIELIPQDSEDDTINKQIIAVNMENLLIERMYIYDAFGNKSTIKFNNIKINKGIKDSVFEFKAPKDVDIQTAP